MLKRNKWRHGKRDFVAPPLPPELVGHSGCLLQTGVVDREVGEEVVLLMMENHPYCERIAALDPPDLRVKTGVARTSHGQVAFVVYSVFDGTERIAAFESFLNPNEIGTFRMLSALAQQTHLHVILMDSDYNCLRGFFEFEDDLGFGDLVTGLAKVVGHEPIGNFALAQQEFMEQYTIEDMLAMGE